MILSTQLNGCRSYLIYTITFIRNSSEMVRDPEKRKATYDRHKERNKQRLLERIDPERRGNLNEAARRSKYRSRYGLHFEEYVGLLSAQEGKCAICGDNSKQLQLDHDHNTGRPRAILCFNCNSGLGQFKDNLLIMAKAITYLMEHNAKR